MLFRDNIVIKKGFVLDTFEGIDDIFVFVNLDMDLYKPTLEALKFFWDKMIPGGMVLLHDCFHAELPGISVAVDDFEKWLGKPVIKVPCDYCSLALIKNL